MKLEQIKGPFSIKSSHTFKAGAGNSYVHIGIQIPKRQPIAYSEYRALNEGKDDIILFPQIPDYDVTITTNESEFSYKVNETGILELDGNFGSKLKFTFEKSMPPETIVDVIYKDEEE